MSKTKKIPGSIKSILADSPFSPWPRPERPTPPAPDLAPYDTLRIHEISRAAADHFGIPLSPSPGLTDASLLALVDPGEPFPMSTDYIDRPFTPYELSDPSIGVSPQPPKQTR